MLNWFDQLLFHNKLVKIRDQKGLWATSFLRSLAYSMMGVFSAIFVFEYGSEHFMSGGLRSGLILLLIHQGGMRIVAIVFGVLVGKHVITKIGYRRTVLGSLLLSIGAFLSLSAVEYFGRWEFVLLSSLLFGFVVITYWVVYRTLFSDDSDDEHMGKSYGALYMTSQAGQIAAPLVGAFIALVFGFSSLFMFGVIFLLLAGVPMFFLPNHLHLDQVSWSEFWSWSREKTFVKMGASFAGRSMDETFRDTFWPVYVFLLVGSLGSIGVLMAVLRVARVVFTYVVSGFYDRGAGRKLQVFGVSGGVVFWVVRLLVRSFPQVLLVDSLDGFFYTMSYTAHSSYMFKRARGKETFSFMVYSTVWESAWVVLAYVLLGLVLWLWGSELFWPAVFGLGALGLTMSLLVKEHK